MWIIMGAVFVPVIVLGIFLINGKGAFLISGYNTMSPEKKVMYDEKALCRFTGWLVIIYSIGLLLGIFLITLETMIMLWSGVAVLILIHIALVIALIYANTGNRLKKPIEEVTEIEITEEYKEKTSKIKKRIIMFAVGITIVTFFGIAALFIIGEREPVVTVTNSSIEISAMYGVTINFNEIIDILLNTSSMSDIGVGSRSNGYNSFSDVLRGEFKSPRHGDVLLFVNSNSSPTIHIMRPGARDVFISFSDSAKTIALFNELNAAFSR
jgi:hypothetical protein